MTFGEASAAMAEKGLAVTVAGDEMPPGDAPVTGSSPGPGTELEFGAAVALDVEWPGSASDSGTDGTVGTDTSGSGSNSSGSDGGSGPAGGSAGTDPGPTEPTTSSPCSDRVNASNRPVSTTNTSSASSPCSTRTSPTASGRLVADAARSPSSASL